MGGAFWGSSDVGLLEYLDAKVGRTRFSDNFSFHWRRARNMVAHEITSRLVFLRRVFRFISDMKRIK